MTDSEHRVPQLRLVGEGERNEVSPRPPASRPAGGASGLAARLFDIRIIIGSLLGIFAIVLLAVAAFGTSEAAKRAAGGINVNLWTGLGLALVAAVFLGWAWRVPQAVDE